MNDSLFIYPHQETDLPFEFHFSHNLSVKLYDDLAWLLLDKTVQSKTKERIKLIDGQTIPKDEDDVIEWMLNNGYKKEADKFISKHVFFAIISDICHYIFQALDSVKKIKMTVGFTLIRKPFLENLLILEQLLTEEVDFLERFESDSKKFDPGKIDKEKKRELIKSSIELIDQPFILEPDLIYDLRWDKNNQNSIYANTNLATHLVTTRNSSYTTENQNFNMIFSGYNEWDSQLWYFYYFVPYLLYYMLEVVDKYMVDYTTVHKCELGCFPVY